MIEECDFHGWEAFSLSTEQVQLIMPKAVGPRVISCALRDEGSNLFATRADELAGTGEEEWKIRGGHRLWHAPEHPVRTRVPDNSSPTIDVLDSGKGLILTQKTEPGTGIEKQMQVEIINSTSFRVTHRLRNHGQWPVRCAAWALSVMKHGGYAVIPFPTKPAIDVHPTFSIIPWSYACLGDSQWKFRDDHLGIDMAVAQTPQKVGISNYRGWSAYWQKTGTFVKYSPVVPGATYPDLGACFEAFTSDWMIELETLSPLSDVSPGSSIEHTEYWGLFKGLQKPDSESAFAQRFLPVIEHWMAHTRA